MIGFGIDGAHGAGAGGGQGGQRGGKIAIPFRHSSGSSGGVGGGEGKGFAGKGTSLLALGTSGGLLLFSNPGIGGGFLDTLGF